MFCGMFNSHCGWLEDKASGRLFRLLCHIRRCAHNVNPTHGISKMTRARQRQTKQEKQCIKSVTFISELLLFSPSQGRQFSVLQIVKELPFWKHWVPLTQGRRNRNKHPSSGSLKNTLFYIHFLIWRSRLVVSGTCSTQQRQVSQARPCCKNSLFDIRNKNEEVNGNCLVICDTKQCFVPFGPSKCHTRKKILNEK